MFGSIILQLVMARPPLEILPQRAQAIARVSARIIEAGHVDFSRMPPPRRSGDGRETRSLVEFE
jgi:hypothetical protein